MAMTEQQMLNEMAVFAGLSGKSPAMDRAVPSKPVLQGDAAVNAQFKDIGVDTVAMDAEVAAEKNKARQDMIKQIHDDSMALERRRVGIDVAEGVAQGLAGIGVGVQDILRNTYNGVVTLTDAAENYAASKGLGTGDLLDGSEKIQSSYGANELDRTGKLSRAVTNFAAPVLATVASGGGNLAAAGVGAAYNFFALDPKSERISDLLKGTAVDEVPIASDVVDYLRTKPGDTEMTARFKNMAEGLGIDAALGVMLWGAARTYSSVARARNPKVLEGLSAEIREGNAVLDAAEAAKATPVTQAEQQALNVSDQAISNVSDAAEMQPRLNLQKSTSAEPPAFDPLPVDELEVVRNKRNLKVTEEESRAYSEYKATHKAVYELAKKADEYLPPDVVSAAMEDINKLREVERQVKKEVYGTERWTSYTEILNKRKELIEKLIEDNKPAALDATDTIESVKQQMVDLSVSMAKEPENTALRGQYDLARKKLSTLNENSRAQKATAVIETVDEQYNLFAKEWANYFDESPGVKVTPEGDVNVRLGDDSLVSYLSNMVKDPEVALALSKPTTDAELLKGANILKNDTDTLKRLASIGADPNYVPNSDDMMALKFIMSKADESMQASALKALDPASGDAALAGFGRDMENYFKILSLQTGAASEQGRTLRVNQILAQQAGLGSEDALKAIGAQGRAKMVEGLVNKYGGRDNIKQMARNVQFIQELTSIQKMPNEAFKVKMNEVVKLTGWMKVEDAITKVALNGMIYSPTTWGRAFITNAATTSKTVIDNYIEAGVGKVLKNGDAKTLAEANAHLKASFMGLFDGIAPAAESIWTGVPRNTRIVKEELAMATNKQAPLMAEDFIEKAGGAWAEKLGVVVNTSVETPARVLIGVDTYWQHVNSQGVIASEAVREGMKRGFVGENLVDFVEKFRANAPTEVLKMADDIASANTMSKQLTGLAESLDNSVDQLGMYMPFNRVVLPFMKTGFNIVEYTVKNSPLAPFLSQDFKMAMRSGGRAKDAAIAKVISGTAVTAGFIVLAENGMIQGEATENPEFQKAMKDNKTVAIGTAVRAGDTWVSLKGLEPLSTAVNIATLLSKARGYVSEGEYDDMVTASRIMLADAVGPEGLTTGLSDILNLANPNKDPKQYLANVATRFVPYGAAMRDVREAVDPKVRSNMAEPAPGSKAQELQEFYSILKNRLSNMVPYVSKTLPLERNIWGEGLMIPDGLGPDAISPVATTTNDGMALKKTLEAMDDFYELNRDVLVGVQKLPLRMPPKQIKNPMADVQYPFTPREYSAYVLLNAGINPTTGEKLLDKTLKERVQATLEKYDAFGKKPQQFNQATYQAMSGELSAIFLQHKKIADKMILKYGDVQAKMADQAMRKNNLEGAINGGQ